jgi:hypothetical protein
VRLCYSDITQFYIHFLNDAVTFGNVGTSMWCINNAKKFSITEMDIKDGKYFNFYDFDAGEPHLQYIDCRKRLGQ